MKIGLVCPYNLFKGGGVQECVLALQKELRARGHDAKIITPMPREYNGEKLPHVLFIGQSRRMRAPQSTSVDISVSVDADKLEQLLEAESFDLLHIHEPLVPILARQLIARASCPVVATFHAAIPENGISKSIAGSIGPFIRSIVKYVDRVTAVSDAATGYIDDFVPRERIRIIPNGIDLVKYADTKIKPAAAKYKTILFVGRLEKRKGVRFLLEAYKELKKSDPYVRLDIVGDGPERERLEEYVHENRLTFVNFKGYVSDSVKRKLLLNADLFVSPAIFGESFGIVLLEAMAMNRVIVAGDNPGYSSVLRGRGQLSLVNPRDTVDFARRLDIMLHDEAIRALWRQWAKDHIKQYDYKKVVDMYVDTYEEALKARKKR